MQIWLTILALASCLMGSIASPLANLPTNLTAQVSVRTSWQALWRAYNHHQAYDQSLQLIFHRSDRRGEKPSIGYWHYVFHGKPGTILRYKLFQARPSFSTGHPIDACESTPVAKIYYGKIEDINEPEWLNSAVR